MSGICGIVALDSASPQEAEICAMTSVLERRGPDGTNVWIDGNVALGHTLLATTPEACVEALPLTDKGTGCTITADARLDNREELFEALGLHQEKRIIGDGELILRAYLAWSEACVDHLLGDFAFAIWDPREDGKLFCARDQVGMRQLIYHHAPGRLFAFATEPRALLQHPSIPHRINEGRIGDFLEDLEAYDLTSTFFEGLFRLPPAHALVLGNRTMRIWRYWSLEAQETLELPSDEAYAAAFLEVFTEAVRCRLRAPGKLGSMLSGGMDSGSIAAVAAQLLKQEGAAPLPTFSAIGVDDDCIETRTIKASATIEHISPNFVSIDSLRSNETKLKTLMTESAEPFDGHMNLVRAVYQAAQDKGLKVVLDGVGGDTTLSSGNMIAWLMDRGRFRDAWLEAKAERHFWGPEWRSTRTFFVLAARGLIPKPLRRMRHAWLSFSQRRRAKRESPIDPAFASRIGMKQRRVRYLETITSTGGYAGSRPAIRMVHPNLVVGRERYDRVAAALALEPRDPFLDRRLIEFCASLPAIQLQAGGWPKIILRRAMRGLMPEAVRWRIGKEHLGWSFTKHLLRASNDLNRNINTDRARIYAKPEVLRLAGEARNCEPAIALSLNLCYLENWLAANEFSQGQMRNGQDEEGQ